ncbi:HPr family phosphocarrier protein [Pseudodesulfovibrio tunisiensis]|uniref:HPr family phosphocarrier protein n=1 Tax=Pseudodesulfovibrio tunisiensis TaxID=463192 RepID=UPI001FB429F1|nr:HPr family phosphocarrier protein [Pseudodesulfovibrio tunisiensis]
MSEQNQIQESGSEEFLSRQVMVVNEHGLHARPAGKLAQAAQGYESSIMLVSDEQEVDAKSILDILTLAACQGSALEIRASGSDAEQALTELALLFENRFSE